MKIREVTAVVAPGGLDCYLLDGISCEYTNSEESSLTLPLIPTAALGIRVPVSATRSPAYVQIHGE